MSTQLNGVTQIHFTAINKFPGIIYANIDDYSHI